MHKSMLFVTSAVLVLLLTSSVLAIGVRTNTDVTIRSDNASVSAEARLACASKETVKDRILCRMQVREATVQSIEESCRNLNDSKRDWCDRFQKEARPCYYKEGREKAVCLRTHVGMGIGQLHQFTEEQRRNYAALLLYELQERVEKKQEQGSITDEQAAELIASIVDLKELILSGASFAEVRVEMQAFKQQWRTIMSANAQVRGSS